MELAFRTALEDEEENVPKHKGLNSYEVTKEGMLGEVALKECQGVTL